MDSIIKDKSLTAYIAVTLPANASVLKARELVNVIRGQKDVLGASFVIHVDGHFNHDPIKDAKVDADDLVKR